MYCVTYLLDTQNMQGNAVGYSSRSLHILGDETSKNNQYKDVTFQEMHKVGLRSTYSN